MIRLRQFFALGLLLWPSCSWKGQSQCPAKVTPIPYRSLGNSQFSIPVKLNRSGPYGFMVDTGSQMTLIEPSLAAELHLEPAGRAQLISGMRTTPAIVVSPDLIEVGPNMAHMVSIVVQDLAHFQSSYPEMRGVLGADFLTGFDVLIDRKKKILCLGPTNDMQHELRGERIPFARVSTNTNRSLMTHSILISVQIADETSRKLNLKLDSGANAPILYTSHLRPESYVERLNLQRGTVVGGNLMYFRTTAPEAIQIGSHVVCGIKFAIAVRFSQDTAPVAEDGLLPISLFNRVFISYRGGFVILEPY